MQSPSQTSAPMPRRRSQISEPAARPNVQVQAGPPVIDALTFGFTVEVGPPGALAPMIDELQADGAKEQRRRLRFRVPIGRAGIVDEGIAELTFAPTEGIIRSDSTFQMNPQRALARELARGLAASTEPTLDDSDNFLGWENYQREDLAALEGQLVGGAVARLAERLNRSLAPDAGASRVEFRLKAAELATHLHVIDAVEAVRWLQRSALPGALAVEHDVYRTNCTWPDEGPTVRWWFMRTGFTVKVYAKTRTVVRIEVSAADRAQVIKLGCGLSRGDIGEADARALIADFREKAGTVLSSAVRHVVAALASTQSIWELQVALLPLTRLAAGGAAAAGRPPGEGAVEAAREALEAIFSCGLYVCQHRKGHAIRACLDGLSGPGGPLVREGWRSAYTLAPQFARAASTLVRSAARRGRA